MVCACVWNGLELGDLSAAVPTTLGLNFFKCKMRGGIQSCTSTFPSVPQFPPEFCKRESRSKTGLHHKRNYVLGVRDVC